MVQFIVQRIIQTIVVLFLLSMLCFFILHLIPGDPILSILGEEATLEEIEKLREELGMNRPLIVQYFSWLGGVLQGDFGTSIIYRESVSSLIVSHLQPTIHIGLIAFMTSLLLGVPMGVMAAVRRGGWIDSFITTTANLGMAAPHFWLAILGIYLFSLKLGWLPVQGYTSMFDDFWLNTKQIIMPSLVLGFSTMAILARQARSSMLEVINQDYIRTARSKGMKKTYIIRKHALKNAMIPVITLSGLMLPNVVGGSIVIEKVFNINGMGRLMLDSVFDQDVVVVQGCLIVIAVTVSLANLLVDLSYGFFDPRIRYK